MAGQSQEARAALEALLNTQPALYAMAEQDMQAAQIRRAEGLLRERPAPPAKQVKPVEVYAAKELYGVQLARPPVIIAGMITAGLVVLAGAPKRGKSWMGLSMAISVAAGAPFLGMSTQQGEVLYMDLESRKYRVQARLAKLLPGPAPDGLYVCHECDRLDGTLLAQLDLWIKGATKPRLVIIDTLGRVKGGSRRGENAYESDTRILGELQRFALQHQIAVVCIHHLKKDTGSDNDYFERISGSMGITGACDTVMVLAGKRGEETSTLKVTSRDFEPMELVLRLDDGRWTLQSTDSEAYRAQQAYIKSPVVRGVLKLMATTDEWRGTSTELLDAILDVTHEMPGDVTAARLGKEVQRLAQQLYDTDQVVVRCRKTNGRRLLCLSKAGETRF